VDCVLWVELKPYTHVLCKFNQLYLNQTAMIYRSVMCLDMCLKETGNVV
jgi:hypothetical protein